MDIFSHISAVWSVLQPTSERLMGLDKTEPTYTATPSTPPRLYSALHQPPEVLNFLAAFTMLYSTLYQPVQGCTQLFISLDKAVLNSISAFTRLYSTVYQPRLYCALNQTPQSSTQLFISLYVRQYSSFTEKSLLTTLGKKIVYTYKVIFRSIF